MALFEDWFSVSDWGWGATGLIGLGAMVVAPSLVSALGSLVRPVAKGVIWGAIALTDGMREIVAGTGAQLSELYAEVRRDYEQTSSSDATSASRIITPESSTLAPAAQIVTPEGKPATER